jgi:PilZ domain
MSWFKETLPKASTAGAAEEEDRRFNDRSRFLKPIHIRQLDPPHSERMGTMRDLSRDGLYFVVHSHNYAVGTRLNLTIPESDSAWTGEVVRTETLPNGGQGVGVRFLSSES